jgi:hypothetical protein
MNVTITPFPYNAYTNNFTFALPIKLAYLIHIVFDMLFDMSICNKIYRGADKSLARPRREQATATEDFDVHVSYLLS